MSRQLKKQIRLKRKRPIANGTYKRLLLKLQRSDEVQVVLVILLMLGSLAFIQIKYREYKLGQILKDPAFAVGTITTVGYGTHLTVNFEVAGSSYSFYRRVSDEQYQGRAVGDTVVVIYSRTDPDNAAIKKGFISGSEN